MRNYVCIFLICLVACAPRGDGTPPDATSRTHPLSNGTPRAAGIFRFAVLGDFGAGTAEQQAVAERMCRWRSRHDFGMVVTAGDNIYPAGQRENFQSRFFDPYACLLDDGVRFHAVLGNHDVGTDNGRPELDEPAFGMRRRNYVVRTKGVRFVLVDSNNLRKRWLRHHLGPEAGDEWTIVAFHFPVFSPGPHGSTPGFAPSLPRMFRRHGVDLVLNGHDHLYAMTEKRKIRYVVTGGGGASLYGCNNPDAVRRCESRHHFLYVVAYADHLTVKAVPPKGKAFASFTTTGRN